MEAMHTTGLLQVPAIPIWLSLIVIGVTMLVTTVASLVKAHRAAGRARSRVRSTQSAADRH
jgi:tellurite resistance protein TerC